MSIFNEARLETWNEVKGLSDEKLNQKPSSDEWSIREVLDHLKKIDMTAQNMLKERVKEAPVKEIEENRLRPHRIEAINGKRRPILNRIMILFQAAK